MRDINLLNDLLFKIVFGNQKNSAALVGLLNAILNRTAERRIVSLEILNPLRDKIRMEDKACILDVRAKEVGGSLFNIEVQVAKQFDYKERTVFYGSTMVSEQPIAGKRYHELVKCVHISLVDFTLFPNHRDVASRFCLYDVAHNEVLTDLLELHYIELNKLKYTHLEELGSSLQRWVYFLRNATNYEQLDELPELLKQEEGMTMAYQATHEALCDQELIYELQARRKFQLDQASNLHGAREEGKLEEKRQTAKRLRSQDLPVELIATVTELSLSELEQLFAEL